MYPPWRRNGMRPARPARRQGPELRPGGAPRKTIAVGCVAAALLALGACESPPRVPYIPAALENWPRPYRGVDGVTIRAFNTGEMQVLPRLIFGYGSLTSARKLDVPAFLIRHPRVGLILFNTGFHAALAREPTAYVGPLLESICHPSAAEHQDLVSALTAVNISPEAIRHVILADLRFDHAGAVEQFPHAQVIVTRPERDYAEHAHLGYLRREYDDVRAWKLIDMPAHAPLGTFTTHVDLFGDGSVNLVPTGATAGSIAVLVRAADRAFFLASGLVPVAETIRYARRPRGLHDPEQWWNSLWQLKKLTELVPEVTVLPGYDLDPARRAPHATVPVHEPTAAEPTPSPPPPERGWRPRVIP